jgi:hypothetical protein
MARDRLSKTRIMFWVQCPKRLWLELRRPELVEYSPATRRLFDMGHGVGRVARELHPGGVLIDPPNLGMALRETARLLARRGDVTLFEATFSHGGVLVRADLLLRTGGVGRMIEVKASTGVRDHHVTDAAIQTWVVRGWGADVTEVALAHVDRDFVYRGDGDYHGLLNEADVTARVDDLVGAVPDWIAGCHETLSGDEPGIDMGEQCYEPFSCPMIPYCGADRPEYHVSLLPDARGVDVELEAAGYADLRDVPEDWPLSDVQRRVWRATRSGSPEFDRPAAASLVELGRPCFYLDFETIQFAVPRWAGTRPWEQQPFQWSCHVERRGGELEHAEFLDLSGEAPMRACAETLLATLGDDGPVLVYSGFEKGVLTSLAERFPDLAAGLERVVGRLVDLLPITRAAYYHPAMMGSWSLKDVLPTIAPDLDYEALEEVRDGSLAQIAYLEAIDESTSAERGDEIARALLEYCRYDTLALVRLAGFLSGAD